MLRSIAIAAFALVAAPAAALPLEIPVRDGGNYFDDGFHNPSNEWFSAGKVGSLTVRNFFVFDLAGLTEPLETLSLSIAPVGRYSSPDAAETITFRAYAGDPGFLINGTAEVGGYVDLGDGTIYGALAIATPVFDAFTPMPAVTIDLNAAAVMDANAIIAAPDDPADVNDKLFAIGGDLGTAAAATQGVWFVGETSDPLGAVTLTGNGAQAQVPLPAALPLTLAGLGALGWAGRRRRG